MASAAATTGGAGSGAGAGGEPATKKARAFGPGDVKAVNTVRALSADTVQGANSGHPGAPMGCAPIAHVLWNATMNYNPANPKWTNRDRFVLSNGHACALQYVMLHLTGYDLSMDDLKQFRQLNSKTPGHPENHITAGVEVSTGPLGQGICNAVGMTIAHNHLAAEFNKPGFDIVDHFVYVICGDGCLQEGVSAEASALAGHLGLGRLIVLYDDNKIQIDGSTDLAFTEDVLKRYEAYGWHTSSVSDGNDNLAGIQSAIEAAKAVTDKPSIIKVSTIIGFGSAKEGTHGVHGAPLGDDDVAAVKTKFGLDPAAKYSVDADVAALYKEGAARAAAAEAAWNKLYSGYKAAHPAEAAEYERRFAGKLPAGWEKGLVKFSPTDKAIATRSTSGTVLNGVAELVPELLGGSADLSPSNKTELKCSFDYQKDTPAGRYLRFGVREHGMAAVCNGIAAYGGLIPYCATFLNFCGYALGAVRLSALSHFRVLYIFTHDSIALGEDGPTHQPIEMLASLRSMPNMTVYRPADGNETAGAYKYALENATGPTVLALSRQNLPQLAKSSLENALLGGYVAHENAAATSAGAAAVILVATGSEVAMCIEAADAMTQGVRVVSMPCVEVFNKQSDAYKRSVFPAGVAVMSVEASSVLGWERLAHTHVAMTTFGASAKGSDAQAHFGFSKDNIVAKATATADYYSSHAVPELLERPF